MKVSTQSVYDLLVRMRQYFIAGDSLMYHATDAPLRSELFNSDQMEKQGSIVAAAHKLAKGRAPDQLLKRLAGNEKVLLEVRNLLGETLKAKRFITPAGEWLLDNFYLIEEQIVIGKKHLPKGYSQSLPRLAEGPSEGLPRVYDIALEIISHSDGRIDLSSLTRFVAAYQTHTKLKLGELWAIPIMLRLALIENLRRVSTHVAMDKIDQNLADYWVEELMEAAEKNPGKLILLIADMARSNPPLGSAFVSEFTRRLQGKGPHLALALNWQEQELMERGLTSNELIHIENQKQAVSQVSMSNSINSLRFLSTTNWQQFVENLSAVDDALRQDPHGTYPLMDFNTRDQYRHKIEYIAKHCSCSEYEIAMLALTIARKHHTGKGPQSKQAHVGYYLVDKGLAELSRLARVKRTVFGRISRFISNRPVSYYGLSVLLICLLLTASLSYLSWYRGMPDWLLVFISAFSLVATSQFAVLFVNWVSTLLVKPEALPRMDYRNGLPVESRTLVIIPTMLMDAAGIEMLLEGIEIRYLANIDAHLHFALLTDFTDAPEESMPEDAGLLRQVTEGITALNRKYHQENRSVFYLLHRPRTWNPGEKVWMGYERKRGKLEALNHLIRNGNKEAFSIVIGDLPILREIKYVITLDTDTQLPRETAWKMVATLAHPLNAPLYHLKKSRVTEGFGILQPRVAVSMPGKESSIYSRLHAMDAGLDPYTRVSSDVYQDLFKEGSFIGKGIYQVDAFERTLANRFPENRILSHDLLEGCYTRSALLSDVQLYEHYPNAYLTDVKRRYRWIRGDWQLLSWILPVVPVYQKKMQRNPLSALSIWKIFDNLRRSLVPIAFLILFITGWLLPYNTAIWTGALLALKFLPDILQVGWDLLHQPEDISLNEHIKECFRKATSGFLLQLFSLATLPFEAAYTADAILRTLWRMWVTKKHLLQWAPSLSVVLPMNASMAGIFLTMWSAPAIALVASLLLSWYNPITLLFAAPIVILWSVSPALTWWVSLPLEPRKPSLEKDEKIFLWKVARRTWAYFAQFVNEEEHWLPPDNYQEHPIGVVARRTSPTNIGLALLANISACDFGFIPSGEGLIRTEKSLQTLDQLEKFRGHLYNWYDTGTLMPLYPRYISSVDSGNLAGHLLTLKQALLQMPQQPIVSPLIFEGIQSTYLILLDELGQQQYPALQQFGRQLDIALKQESRNYPSYKLFLYNLSSWLELCKQEIHEPLSESAGWWLESLILQISQLTDELLYLAPWLILPAMPASFPHLEELENLRTPEEIAQASVSTYAMVDAYTRSAVADEDRQWGIQLQKSLAEATRKARERLEFINELAARCEALADMEYDFLYDASKHLLSIGYNVEESRRDPSYYDLLASEARLATFVAIAQGKLPQESWFALGRLLTNPGFDPVLLSWSGSMFEYLMPLLVMPTYENTLLDQTMKSAVERQIEYGKSRELPWGISESGYNMVDVHMNYQYKAFGVPGLGLKRGLGDDHVIAPYASVMALMVAPEDSCENLVKLEEAGFMGKYGFYEAIDYTSARMPRGQSQVLIRSFMAHHEGMSLLSLAYLLLNKPMQARFEAEPRFQATLLLLQERIPRAVIFYAHTEDLTETTVQPVAHEMQVINTPNTPIPEVQLMSNSKYQLMITNSGSGYSRWKDLAVTRWREDSTCDNRGVYCYIKDLETGTVWCNTYQPVNTLPRSFTAVFSQGHAEFRRMDDGFETKTDIAVSPEDDIEIRRIRITNKTGGSKLLELTSYAEVVLAPAAADASHPAFSNLFVQTEILQAFPAIVCTRRPRSEKELPPWMFHLMTLRGADAAAVSFETDRMRFIGRNLDLSDPAALQVNGPLSGTQGPVLDPIVAIRHRVVLKANQSVELDLVLGISESRSTCLELLAKYQDRHLRNRAFELSWTHSQVLLRQINATEADAVLYNKIAGSIIFSNPALRCDASVIKNNRRGQPGLWSYSISGDLPIVLLHVHSHEQIGLVKQLVQAHAFWRLKGLAVDLVIWNEDHGSYRQTLHDQILGLITASGGSYLSDKPGGIFVRAAEQIPAEDRILFQTVARVVINDNKGALAEQINRRAIPRALAPQLIPVKIQQPQKETPFQLPPDLIFPNSLGGFAADGKEYLVLRDARTRTPAPWVNVLANAQFGTVITESGSAYTWAVNAHEYRLTPWSNDPVSDSAGEAYYLRDEETGHYWCPCPWPFEGSASYLTRHGFGYSVFSCRNDGIHSELWVYVDEAEAIKFMVLKVQNVSGRFRKLSATGYFDLVLGDLRQKQMMHVVSETEPATGALLAKNQYNSVFSERVVFFDTDETTRTHTGDRTEFIGRNRSLRSPEALQRTKLSGKTGASMDPCLAIQVGFDLYDGQEKEIIFRLGSGANEADAIRLIQQFRGPEAATRSLEKLQQYWTDSLGSIQVKTPDMALNLLANGWLLYQTLACRIWARSGFYQSGGAFGFRDQLQDVLALLPTQPAITRQQILLAASRHFAEGDVQHWWHPPEGRGVRTRCSDDYLWLPFATAAYVKATADVAVLQEKISFLEGRILNEEEESYYDLPSRSPLTENLYGHCVRAIRFGLRFGVNGLPLMGSGDWNDGMDQVGIHGKGESVWLGFFLYKVLIEFQDIARRMQDLNFAAECTDKAATLKLALNEKAWDGAWYRRAYFDDGTPLGSAQNEECRIDSISQSWSVLSGAGDPERVSRAMDSVNQYLVNRKVGIIQLLDPPFDQGNLNPGYIKGYVPGVRENGGQYTHAAIWTMMAFAKLQQPELVWELFSMINPVTHGHNQEAMLSYRVEPYVVAADIYGRAPHAGRGGWTWYTGSAGWMYQFILEYLLGVQRRGDTLSLQPCLPAAWPAVEFSYPCGSSRYTIRYERTMNRADAGSIRLDDQPVEHNLVPFVDDGRTHLVVLQL
jgi:cyclic beta-1,2-glucan synthetase